jgi:hypothetical protein
MSLADKVVVMGFRRDSLKKRLIDAGAKVVTPSAVICVSKDGVKVNLDTVDVHSFNEKYFECKEGQVRNPKTGRCVKQKPKTNNDSPRENTNDTTTKLIAIDDSLATFDIEDQGSKKCQFVYVSLKNADTKDLIAAHIERHRSLAAVGVKLPPSIATKLRKGAVVCVDYNHLPYDRNDGVFGIWNGKKIVPLDFNISDYGAIPMEFDIKSMRVPLDFWDDLPYFGEINYINVKDKDVKKKMVTTQYYDGEAYVLTLCKTMYYYPVDRDVTPNKKGWLIIDLKGLYKFKY